MIEVYDNYTNDKVAVFPTRAAAIEWITDRAQEWNYGMYRIYSIDGKDFYDVGPRTFYIFSEK